MMDNISQYYCIFNSLGKHEKLLRTLKVCVNIVHIFMVLWFSWVCVKNKQCHRKFVHVT